MIIKMGRLSHFIHAETEGETFREKEGVEGYIVHVAEDI